MPEKTNAPQTADANQTADASGSTGTIEKAWEGITSVINKLVDALNQLKTVHVSTLASDLELIIETDASKKQNKVVGVQPLGDPKAANVEGLVTEIDMLQGDIRHFRSKKISAALEKQFQEVHSRHVELAQKIFLENVKFAADTVQRFRRDERQ
jgi:hypothetical protein